MASSTQKESTSFKIFVGGLEPETTEDDLTEYFSEFGRVIERLIKVDIKTKRSRGFAFIGFKSPESVDRVLQVEHHYINGKKIDCKRAMTKEDAYSLNRNLKDSCRKVYISNIPKELSRKDLQDFFNQFGKIIDFNLIFKKKETGFLYIIYDNEEDAMSLIERKFVEINGFRLEIQKAIPKESKDVQEDEAKSKAPQSFHHNRTPHYRDSFEAPFSYQSTPMFSVPNTPGVPMGKNYKQSLHQYSQYEPVGPDRSNHISHHLVEGMGHYDIPMVKQHAHHISVGDYGYAPSRIYAQQAAQFPPSQADPFFDRVPVRHRVRSEQAINTINPLFVKQPPSPTYQVASEFRHVVPRSRMGVQSFSHVDEGSFGLLNIPGYSQNLAEPRESPANRPSLRDSGQNATPEFIENKIDFKSFRPKESSPGKNEGQSALVQRKDTVNGKIEHRTDSRKTKLAKIKLLEDEIKATKEKLKSLEDLLKQELATVEERPSHKEGLSQSSNYD